MEVNLEYVQNKVKRQMKNKQSSQFQKRNKNKDKGQMRSKEIVRDYEIADNFWIDQTVYPLNIINGFSLFQSLN